MRHTPCTIHHTPCTIHHPPSTIHHTPYAIRSYTILTSLPSIRIPSRYVHPGLVQCGGFSEEELQQAGVTAVYSDDPMLAGEGDGGGDGGGVGGEEGGGGLQGMARGANKVGGEKREEGIRGEGKREEEARPVVFMSTSANPRGRTMASLQMGYEAHKRNELPPHRLPSPPPPGGGEGEGGTEGGTAQTGGEGGAEEGGFVRSRVEEVSEVQLCRRDSSVTAHGHSETASFRRL
jgi:hypothetical protein